MPWPNALPCVMRVLLLFIVICGLSWPVLTKAQTPNAQQRTPTDDATLREFMGFYQPYLKTQGQALTEANRSGKELQVWVSEKIADFFTLDPKTATMTLNQSRPYFTADAYNNYLMALGSLPYAEQLRNGQVRLSTIVQTMPALLSSGSVGGRYIWVYEINALISASTIRQGIALQGEPTTQVTFRIQLARSFNAPPPHSVLIDVWQTRSVGKATESMPNATPSAPAPVVVN